jgi:hypothetical protein
MQPMSCVFAKIRSAKTASQPGFPLGDEWARGPDLHRLELASLTWRTSPIWSSDTI